LRISKRRVLTLLLFVAVGIETLSAIEWTAYPYFPDKSLLFARVDALVFSTLAPLSPTLLILLFYSWLARLVVSLDNKISRTLKRAFGWLTQSFSGLGKQTGSDFNSGFSPFNHPKHLLAVSIVTALLLALIPYRPDLNPTMSPVGVDAHFYLDWLGQMLGRSPAGAISYAMGEAAQGSRPLLLIPLYLVVSTGVITDSQAVEYLPLLLGPALAIATFLFVREGQKSERMAGIASLFSTLSFNTTVGMWAGFYANWLALTEAYLFLAIMLRFSATPSRSRLLTLIVLSFSLLLTHAYTWVIILSVSTVFIVTLWKDSRKTILVKYLALILAANIALDIVKTQTFGGSIAAQDASQSLNESGISQSLNFWPNINAGLFVAYDGLLGSAIILAISLVAILFLKYRDGFERVLALWVALASIPFPLLSSLIQTRIIYDLPVPSLETIGLLLLIRPVRGDTIQSSMIILLIALLGVNYTLRALTNLVAMPF
jgi:hypothetical protein